MQKLSCVLIDDEQHCLDILEKMIQKSFSNEIEIIGLYTNPIDALKNIHMRMPDILFCDVEMPRLSGIDLVNTLQEETVQLVFTTAHSKYAIEAIKLAAVDYLVKPFSIEELNEAVERCKKRLKQDKEKQQLTTLKKSATTKVTIHLSNGTIQFIDSADIVYIESQSNYSHFILKDKPKIVVSKTLKEFDELLTPYGFFRIHHSYLVNLTYIDFYKGGTEEALVLKNGDTVYVSRRRKQEFLEIMKK